MNAAATTEKISTYTGRKPLKAVQFTVKDPDNTERLSTKKVAHSFGAASGGKVHSIAEESQKYFDSKGFDAVTYDTDSGKTLYLTFDCGYENGYTSKILDTLKEKKVPAAFFCTLHFVLYILETVLC